MILAEAMAAGFDYAHAISAPRSLLEDVIATGQLMSGRFQRVFTDEKDIEDDFRRTFAAK